MDDFFEALFEALPLYVVVAVLLLVLVIGAFFVIRGAL